MKKIVVWCIAEEKILVVVPVQSILLIPLRVSQVTALEYRQFGGIQASVMKSFYRKRTGVVFLNIDVGGRVLSQISSWL